MKNKKLSALPSYEITEKGTQKLRGIPKFFLCSTLLTRRKNFLLYFFSELKTSHLSYSIYKICFDRHTNHGIAQFHLYAAYSDQHGIFSIDENGTYFLLNYFLQDVTI